MLQDKLDRMEVEIFTDGTFRINAHFNGVGFGMNFPSHPDWKKVVARLHSMATLIEEHFATPRSPTLRAAVQSEQDKAFSKWECSFCGSINYSSGHRCATCGTLRPNRSAGG
jgi:hypothetical protein